jgi:hypothetical protein
MGSQGCALDVKKSKAGLKRLGSSRLPAVTKTNCGNPDVFEKNSAAAVGTKSGAECVAAVGAALTATNKSTLLSRIALNKVWA